MHPLMGVGATFGPKPENLVSFEYASCTEPGISNINGIVGGSFPCVLALPSLTLENLEWSGTEWNQK